MTERQPLDVSIVMTVHNGEPHLAAQLQSIADQSSGFEQFVVADDGSTDASATLVEAFEHRTTLIRLDSGQGTNRAMQEALGHVTNPLVGFCDHDDVWHRDKLRTLAACFEDPEVVLACSDARLIDAEGNQQAGTLWQRRGLTGHRLSALHEDPLRALLPRSLITGATMMFRHSLLPRILPLPEEILPGHPAAEANPMFVDRWISLVAAGSGRIAGVQATLTDYRVHAAQQTGPGPLSRRRQITPSMLVSQQQMCASLEAEQQQLRRLEERLPTSATAALEEYDAVLARRIALPTRRRQRLASVGGHMVKDLRHGRLDALGSLADLIRPGSTPLP